MKILYIPEQMSNVLLGLNCFTMWYSPHYCFNDYHFCLVFITCLYCWFCEYFSKYMVSEFIVFTFNSLLGSITLPWQYYCGWRVRWSLAYMVTQICNLSHHNFFNALKCEEVSLEEANYLWLMNVQVLLRDLICYQFISLCSPSKYISDFLLSIQPSYIECKYIYMLVFVYLNVVNSASIMSYINS